MKTNVETLELIYKLREIHPCNGCSHLNDRLKLANKHCRICVNYTSQHKNDMYKPIDLLLK
jgi:hypothetical protein